MASMTDLIKNHLKIAMALLAASTTVFGAVGGGAVTYFFAMQQSRENRFSDSLMEQYKAVADAKRELYLTTDKFTLALAKGKTPDADVVADLDKKLLDLHQRIDVFSLGLTDVDRSKLEDVKTALANVKIEAAQSKTKSDLPYFTGRLAQLETAYKAAQPIVERKIGVPNAILTG